MGKKGKCHQCPSTNAIINKRAVAEKTMAENELDDSMFGSVMLCKKSRANLEEHLKSNFPFICLCVRSFSGIEIGPEIKCDLLTKC